MRDQASYRSEEWAGGFQVRLLPRTMRLIPWAAPLRPKRARREMVRRASQVPPRVHSRVCIGAEELISTTSPPDNMLRLRRQRARCNLAQSLMPPPEAGRTFRSKRFRAQILWSCRCDRQRRSRSPYGLLFRRYLSNVPPLARWLVNEVRCFPRANLSATRHDTAPVEAALRHYGGSCSSYSLATSIPRGRRRRRQLTRRAAIRHRYE